MHFAAFNSFVIQLSSCCVKKTSNSLMCCLYFDCLSLSVLLAEFVVFSRIFSRISGVQPYFQPNFVVSAKIRLIRISAEKMVQPAEFL